MDTPAPEPFPDAFRELLATLAALEQRILHRVDESAAETRGYVDASHAETRRYIDEQGVQTHRDIDEQGVQTRRYVDEQSVETRRHAGVVAEGLMMKIELVAEGVRGTNERLDRFQGEVRAQFTRVDRRLLRLEARRFRKRDR